MNRHAVKLKGFARVKLWGQYLRRRELKGISEGKGRWVCQEAAKHLEFGLN